MRTEIYLWIEPLIMDHAKVDSGIKLYFKTVVDGDQTSHSMDYIENTFIIGTLLQSIMDFANIESNWNYGVVSTILTKNKIGIQLVDSPDLKIEKEKIKVENKKIVRENKSLERKISDVATGKVDMPFQKENIEILESGIIKISVPGLKINEIFDFKTIWANLEQHFIGKIKEGDTVTLTDNNGNTLFTMTGGSFLNIGLADISIYDKKLKSKSDSIFHKHIGLKGGLFVRDNGSFHIGDMDRTFFLQIHTKNILKAALLSKTSLQDIFDTKLLPAPKKETL